MVTVKYGNAVLYQASFSSSFVCVNVHYVWIHPVRLGPSGPIEILSYLHFCSRQAGRQ